MTDNTVKRECRQKQLALHARIKYREQALQGYKQHFKNSTLPRRMKSVKPYPKMHTPEAQTIVNEACQQVDKIILDQLILEQERKLKRDQDSLQTLKRERVISESDVQTSLVTSL